MSLLTAIEAGYSRDATTIYIDRHLPRTIRWRGKDVRLEPFLVCHEIVEKALLDELRLHYLHAHQIASRIERDAVRGAGLTWRHYQSVIKAHEKAIDEEQLRCVPGDLDLTPCSDAWSKHRSSSLRGMVQGTETAGN
ncbi:hypothetical protein LB565_08835 [Mesorhizobium sp. CA14]|uniref:hypothetical protein n=1 Tax=Mesorhizobium sp. CA14 TaxID=2876642 RepID=UPI001CCD9DD7|nr:hypothetical protein [Mesorhizobium sp. CA14]MBZ9848089.1 hypothetical protein [Mesorhizobium sp. CA14]